MMIDMFCANHKKRVTLILREEKTNNKIAKVKFSKQESAMLRELADLTGRELEDIIGYALEAAVRDLK
jgi:hypothetical protein